MHYCKPLIQTRHLTEWRTDWQAHILLNEMASKSRLAMLQERAHKAISSPFDSFTF